MVVVVLIVVVVVCVVLVVHVVAIVCVVVVVIADSGCVSSKNILVGSLCSTCSVGSQDLVPQLLGLCRHGAQLIK